MEADDDGVVAATFCATLVDEWVSLGLTDAVLCPGSRNTPITLAVMGDQRIRTRIVHDERSAAFIALGIALASGRPALLGCTSGSAAAHFHPAVLEADMAAVPMLLLTADRPPELHGRFAPQTIDQRDLYGSATRWYCEPGPPASGGSPWWRDLARDALARCCGEVPGPVHLNLAFREPLTGVRSALPPRSDPDGSLMITAPRWSITDEDLARLAPQVSAKRVLVVAGARSARTEAERRAVTGFLQRMGWPVLADGPSGLGRGAVSLVEHHEAVLRSGRFDGHRPEVVIHLGGLLASRATNAWLAESQAVHIGVDRHGRCPDPDGVLSMSFTAVPSELLARLAEVGPQPAPRRWSDRWATASTAAAAAVPGAIDAASPGTLNEPAVAREVMAAVPGGGSLLVASSMPVRDLEAFAARRDDVTVHANRGTNGIDGTIATGTGIAIGSDRPVVVLCGDIAFLHDVGSLNGLDGRAVDLTVVVVDNDGGGIFHFLPQAEVLDGSTFEEAFGTPHGHDLVAITRSFGIETAIATSREALRNALADATAGGVRFVFVRTDRRANVEVHRSITCTLGDAVAGMLG